MFHLQIPLSDSWSKSKKQLVQRGASILKSLYDQRANPNLVFGLVIIWQKDGHELLCQFTSFVCESARSICYFNLEISIIGS
jgi:hypothetical protein